MESNSLLWLEVKTAYIDANFEALVNYLRDKTPEGDDGYVQTLDLLRRRVGEYMDDIQKNDLTNNTLEHSQGFDLLWFVRLMGAYLLAKQKTGQMDYDALSALVNVAITAANENYTPEQLQILWDVLRACMLQQSVLNMGFTWNDIQNQDLTAHVFFVERFCHIQFAPPAPNTTACFEQAGTLWVDDSHVYLAPLDKYTFWKEKDNLYNFISCVDADASLQIKVKEKEDRLSQTEMGNLLANEQKFYGFIMEQRNVKPQKNGASNLQKSSETTASLDAINFNDVIEVRITSSDDFTGYTRIFVETTDESCQTVSGEIYIVEKVNLFSNPYLSIERKEFQDYLLQTWAEAYGKEVTLMAQYQDNTHYKFNLHSAYVDYYQRCFAMQNEGTIHRGRLMRTLKKTSQYLLENGLLVTVYNLEPTMPLFAEIKVNQVTWDNNKFLVYGELCGDSVDNDETEEEFVAAARMAFLEDFVRVYERQDSVLPVAPTTQTTNATIEASPLTISSLVVATLARVAYLQALCVEQSDERYLRLYQACFLAELNCHQQDSAYIRFELKYQQEIMHFASREAMNVLTPPEELLGHPRVQTKVEVLEVLSSYPFVYTDSMRMKTFVRSDEELLKRVRSLADSAKSLNGIIPVASQDIMRQRIAKILDVEDRYITILDERDHSEEEGQYLEYKSSIVYPAGGNGLPNLSKQLHEILKAVCGFLNSETGGILWLGVNDDRNDVGVESDIAYLLRERKVPDATPDKFRLFIENQLCQAFTTSDGLASGMDIIQGRVEISIHTNPKKCIVLRVQIKPYEYDMVQFKSDSDAWPYGAGKCYDRVGGSTIEVKNDLQKRNIIERKKKNTDSLASHVRIILQAIKENRSIRIPQYASGYHAEPHTVVVEPCVGGYFPQHQSVVCYCPEEQKNKMYKISRMTGLTLGEPCQCQSKHLQNPKVDLFGFLCGDDVTPIQVKVQMDSYVKSLLLERFPAAQSLLDSEDVNSQLIKFDGGWQLSLSIYDERGLAHFLLNVLDHVQKIESPEVNQYIAQYLQKYSQRYN
ncbi:MAG: WYL domain-containing protein [Bacteroidales bacterium]|nr:WYL domain-containing protein [Bacteroidales bacterium]